MALGILMMLVFLEVMAFMTWAAIQANRDPDSPRLSKGLRVFAAVGMATFCAYLVVAALWPAMRCCS
jgi:hypothetical protein